MTKMRFMTEEQNADIKLAQDFVDAISIQTLLGVEFDSAKPFRQMLDIIHRQNLVIEKACEQRDKANYNHYKFIEAAKDVILGLRDKNNKELQDIMKGGAK